MNIGEKLRILRESNNMTRKDAVDKLKNFNIDISDKTLYGYESGRNSANADMFLALCKVYKCNNVMEVFSDTVDDILFTNAEWEHLEKYRNLDDNGRTHVDTVLDWETQRMELYKQALAEREQQKPQIVEIEKVAPPRYSIIYYQRLASAGTGEYLFNDIPTDIIEVLDTPIARRADFALGVNGNSMEPTYYDGDKVYVEITDEIPTGSIGIFTRGNECLIKELGIDRLISHNKEYGDIPAREDIKLVGLVLGKVAEV